MTKPQNNISTLNIEIAWLSEALFPVLSILYCEMQENVTDKMEIIVEQNLTIILCVGQTR